MATIIIDTREQRPLTFSHLPSERGTLQSGDYSIKGLEHEFAVERKSIPDLLGSLTTGRARFERELHRLRGFSFARILIVGTPDEAWAEKGGIKATNCRVAPSPPPCLKDSRPDITSSDTSQTTV